MWKKKWTTVFCTDDRDKLFRLQALLDAEGIPFHTDDPNGARGALGVRTPAVQRDNAGTLRELLVREEDAERVRAVIRNL
ncbi:DUF2007 domain-containing protein [Clostridium sp. D33t1_170424_F3]|uniref:putative signal transducing protein n=1 Tax=Clostridium sp. D33t1_170424_F3 TaxID=2787099 RepID=UPI0018A8AC12|nr:DUF2007 domain-containing protein [Clostridium sp. D33t1_170424_F3]